jgi:hypothetical protein
VAASGIFLNSEHPVSKRTAIFEDDGGAAYLYLTVPREMRPDGDVVVYCTGVLASKADALKAAQSGLPPPLTADAASPEAVVRDAAPTDFSFKWTADGSGVALVRKGKPVAMLLSGPTKTRGYSRALAREGFFGKPWDQAVYSSSFK